MLQKNCHGDLSRWAPGFEGEPLRRPVRAETATFATFCCTQFGIRCVYTFSDSFSSVVSSLLRDGVANILGPFVTVLCYAIQNSDRENGIAQFWQLFPETLAHHTRSLFARRAGKKAGARTGWRQTCWCWSLNVKDGIRQPAVLASSELWQTLRIVPISIATPENKTSSCWHNKSMKAPSWQYDVT